MASLRDVTPTYYEAADLSNELLTYMAGHGVSPAGNIIIVYFTGGGDREFGVDQEVCFPVEGELLENDRVKVRELPAIETAATLIHQGPWEGLVETYQTLGTWIETNGYQIAGSNRDYFLQGGEKMDTSEYRCELVFPVEKAGSR